MYIYIYIYIMCVCLIFFIWNAYFLKKTNRSSNYYYLLWMNAPLNAPEKPTRWVSEGCPLSTEWEVIERGFGGCARARGRIEGCPRGRVLPSKATLKVALDGGTRPGDTLQIHPHFLSLMGDGQANAFRWRDTSPRATLSVVLWITYNFDLIIYNDYYKIP